MVVGTQNSDIEFKRSVISNVAAFGDKDAKNKKPKKKNYKKYLKEAPQLPETTEKQEAEV